MNHILFGTSGRDFWEVQKGMSKIAAHTVCRYLNRLVWSKDVHELISSDPNSSSYLIETIKYFYMIEESCEQSG